MYKRKIGYICTDKTTIDMKKIFTFALLFIATLATAQVSRPKLVVGLVVDQMRWDYLYYFQNDYGEGGLKRLLTDGYTFEDCEINYAPTFTAIGHSSVYTGSVPALHGICGNGFYQDDKPVYCCYDDDVQSVGSNSKEGKMSPHRLLATTIGDELRLSTDFKSRVYGVALKDRAAILPAGHSANAAYWWDTSAGHFVSSTFYMNELPDWVKKFNKQYQQKPKTDVKTSNLGVTLTFRMAEAILQNEKLGQGDATDMLCVSISSTDAIGHTFSTRAQETHDVYMQLDKDLTTFLNTLDQTVGRDNYLIFLSADHGASHNYNFLKEHRIPAGAWRYDDAVNELNDVINQKFGVKPVMGEDNYQFFLNDSLIDAKGLNKQDIVDVAVAHLKKDPQYLYVLDSEKIGSSTLPAMLKERMVNGYRRDRCGEITVITRVQHFGATDSPDYRGTTHGQPFTYDSHIPFVLMGWNVPHGASVEPVNITDIAPTVCSLLHIQKPDASIGHAKEMK